MTSTQSPRKMIAGCGTLLPRLSIRSSIVRFVGAEVVLKPR